MVSIARICEKIIEHKPFLQEALSKGIINYGALAETIQEQVKTEYGKPVKFAAVMMALRRLKEKLEQSPVGKAKFSADSDLSIKSDLIEITVTRHPKTHMLINSFYETIDPKRGDFFTVTTGTHEITLVCNKRYKKPFLKKINKEDLLIVKENLAAITVRIPQESLETPGTFYLITRALLWENINIVEVVSTYTEETIIINTKDVGQAFYALERMMKENQ